MDDYRYEELLTFRNVNRVQGQLRTEKVNVLKTIKQRKRKDEEKRKIEKDVIREAFEAQIENMD